LRFSTLLGRRKSHNFTSSQKNIWAMFLQGTTGSVGSLKPISLHICLVWFENVFFVHEKHDLSNVVLTNVYNRLAHHDCTLSGKISSGKKSGEKLGNIQHKLPRKKNKSAINHPLFIRGSSGLGGTHRVLARGEHRHWSQPKKNSWPKADLT